MSSATKEYIWQTVSSLENKRNDILQQQQILNDWEEQCRTIDVDVSRLGMASKPSNVVGNPVTLHQIW
jgi:hypothetical protein